MYIITGKKGSFSDIIARRVSEQIRDESIVHANPREISKMSDKIKVIYIHIPFSDSWDWFMYDDINNKDKLSLFYDEIMDFRELERVDYKIELSSSGEWRDVANRIVRLILSDRKETNGEESL